MTWTWISLALTRNLSYDLLILHWDLVGLTLDFLLEFVNLDLKLDLEFGGLA